METYEKFVVENSSLVGTIEAAAHSIAFLSPSRVRDSEVRSEGLYTAINLLSLYHEHIRSKHGVSSAPKSTPKATMLRATQTVEVLLEMASISFTGGSGQKWYLVMAIELFKALLRVAMLREQRWRMVLEPDGVDPSALSSTTTGTRRSRASHLEFADMEGTHQYTGKRSGRMLRSVREPTAVAGPEGSVAAMLGVKQTRVLAELLHIMRPVAYLAAYIRHQNSWAPWLLSAAMDALSMKLHGEAQLTPAESTEMTRRHSLLFLYLVRSPVYDSVFRPLCMFFFNRLWSKIPVVREIAETFIGVFDGLHSLHFYKAGS